MLKELDRLYKSIVDKDKQITRTNNLESNPRREQSIDTYITELQSYITKYNQKQLEFLKNRHIIEEQRTKLYQQRNVILGYLEKYPKKGDSSRSKSATTTKNKTPNQIRIEKRQQIILPPLNRFGVDDYIPTYTEQQPKKKSFASSSRVAPTPASSSAQQPPKKKWNIREWINKKYNEYKEYRKIASDNRMAAKSHKIAATQSKVSKRTTDQTSKDTKSSIIYYIILRSKYLHQFIDGINKILLNSNFNTFNATKLGELNGILEELSILNQEDMDIDLDLEEIELFKKLISYNKIIDRFLNSIIGILTSNTKANFLEWLSNDDIKNIILSYNKSILKDDWKYEEDNGIHDEYLPDKSFLTVNPIEDYEIQAKSYIRLNKLEYTVNQSGGYFTFTRAYPFIKKKENNPIEKKQSVAQNGDEIIGDINLKGFKTLDISTLEEIIKWDIIEFLKIINNVLIYIDIIALYVRLNNDTQIDIVSLTIDDTILKSNTYLDQLLEGGIFGVYTKEMLKDFKIYKSIYLYYHNSLEEEPYAGNSSGGRKRIVGRPRKTPTKPTKKPATKPAKKPTTKPAKKPTTKPAKPTTKPAKSTKKPTNPVAKKPTKK